MKYPHWLHFLSLEKDFIETIQFVEIDDKNNTAFSVAYAKLLLTNYTSDSYVKVSQFVPVDTVWASY